MPAHYELKSAKDGRVFFNLRATNGEVVLTSQMYASRAGALKGIAAVQRHSRQAANFECRVGKAGKSHFVLKAANHRVIGTSETYNSQAALENGISSVQKNGPQAKIG